MASSAPAREQGVDVPAATAAPGDAGVDRDGFVLRLRRLRTELRPGKQFARTVSEYQAFYDRQKLPGLEGVAFERQGPGDNGGSGSKYHRRIAAGTYPLLTQDGSNYRTIGYLTNGEHPRPALLVGETGQRVAILVHPGSAYLSSIGCINLSKPLGGATDDISYGESQLHVVAMINAMRVELGAGFPQRNGYRITGAWLVIEGEPPNVEHPSRGVLRGLARGGTSERALTASLTDLTGQEIYALIAATMSGDELPERVSARLFEQVSRQVADLGGVRGEFGRNLWSAWASGWQTSATMDAEQRARAQKDLHEIARRLQAARVDINDPQGLSTPLTEAARANEWEALRALHALGADLNLRDRQGDTPLTAAAYYGCREAVAYLVAAGADRDAKVGEPRVSRSLSADAEPLGEPVVCPSQSDALACVARGRALNDGNAVRQRDYVQITTALNQVKLGSVCHVWDYRARSCKESVDVWQSPGSEAAYFLSKLEVDADGAPRAYHPQDRAPPANAAKAFDWLANLASADRHGTQGQGGAVGPAAGFIISATSLVDVRYPANDTRRYVDASTIPYVVLPQATFPLPAVMALKGGCVVCVVDTHTGGYSGAIFADVGRAVGEGSIRLAQRLGLTPFSAHRWPKVVGFDGADNNRRFLYLVFPHTTVPPPWSVDDIQNMADTLFAQWGGAERLAAIVPGLPPLKPPQTVFPEGPPAATREATADEAEAAGRRLRGLDGPKSPLPPQEPAVPAAAEGATDAGDGVDTAPTPGKVAPNPQELVRERRPAAIHPDEIDGPTDLPAEAAARAALPRVSWPDTDSEAPCYAHLLVDGEASRPDSAPFAFTGEDLRLLCAANAFQPEGHGDRIAFALRGATLAKGEALVGVDSLALLEARPDHRDFRCVIGIFDLRSGKISAFKASTVPNTAYMTNYYKKVHGIRPHTQTGANLLPTGCYVFRVSAHRDSIYPALRLTDPEKLGEDGMAVVLRTRDDLSYRLDGVWDACVPYDHVHCAYSHESFSSAGCLTVCGPNHSGPWGQFQDLLKGVPRDGRLDLVLLTGREACLAARLRGEHRELGDQTARRALLRLRPGSQGDAVRRLQTLLGQQPSGYFGWRTKQALVEHQRRSGLACDGIYAPALDQRLGWDVLGAAPVAAPAVASPSAHAAAHVAGSEPAPAAGPPAASPAPAAARIAGSEQPAASRSAALGRSPPTVGAHQHGETLPGPQSGTMRQLIYVRRIAAALGLLVCVFLVLFVLTLRGWVGDSLLPWVSLAFAATVLAALGAMCVAVGLSSRRSGVAAHIAPSEANAGEDPPARSDVAPAAE
jgi:hypothetical protein